MLHSADEESQNQITVAVAATGGSLFVVTIVIIGITCAYFRWVLTFLFFADEYALCMKQFLYLKLFDLSF